MTCSESDLEGKKHSSKLFKFTCTDIGDATNLVSLQEVYEQKGIALPEKLLPLLISILTDTRCTFFDFNRLNHDIARECVKCLQRRIELMDPCGT